METTENMSLLRYMHIWHSGYSSTKDGERCPSFLWLRQMILELLNDFLPYTTVEVIHELSEEETEKEDEKLQTIPIDDVFQLVKHIVKDLLERISVSICQKLGYDDLPTETAISHMKSRELDHFRSTCTITFKKTQAETVSTSVSISINNEDEDFVLLAKINRRVVALCNNTMPLVTVLCQYKPINAGELCFYDYSVAVDSVLDSCVSSIVSKIRELTENKTIDGHRIPVYFSAVEKRDNGLYSSISVCKLLEAEQEPKSVAAVADWNQYCVASCEEAVNVAFTTINGTK